MVIHDRPNDSDGKKKQIAFVESEALWTQDVEVFSCKMAYQGFFRVDSYSLRYRLYNGRWGETVEREVFDRGHAVAVLLYDPYKDSVVLIKQFRIGALTVCWNPWLLEVVAGMKVSGETAEQVARREVREEAGCDITILERVGHYLVSPGASSEIVELFCGKVDSLCAVGVHGVKEENEDIRVCVVSAESALRLLEQGIFNNGAILILMLWFAIHRNRLRHEWRT